MWITAVVAAIALALLGTAAFSASPVQHAATELEGELATLGFDGDVDGVPGLLVYSGDTPDSDVGRVTLSRWKGTPEHYAARFLELRSSDLEEEHMVPHASVIVLDGAAYGSSGDVPFAAEWAAVQVGDETVLVMRPKDQNARWVGVDLVAWISNRLPDLDAAGFDLDVAETFAAPADE